MARVVHWTMSSLSRVYPRQYLSELVRATNEKASSARYREHLRVLGRPEGVRVDAGVIILQQRLRRYHNGLRDANRWRRRHVRLVGYCMTHQSRDCPVPAIGVALSGATAATFGNDELGSGERPRLHYVSLYRSAPRGVHCSYWNQARVCAFLSSSTISSSSSPSSLPSSPSRYICVYVERARYAHRLSNRGSTRVKSTPLPSTTRCASARVTRYNVQLNWRRTCECQDTEQRQITSPGWTKRIENSVIFA